MTDTVRLEPAAAAFVEATANPPYLFDLGPIEGRRAVDTVQTTDVPRPAVASSELSVPTPFGSVPVRIVRPPHATGALPVVVYVHGGGWVFGSPVTHDRLVREIAVRTGCAVVFVEYTRSPEARYPQALEEAWAVLEWVAREGRENALDAARTAVAGDSAGGCLAAALTLLAAERRGPALRAQVLFYPVTDAAFETPSYHRFATGWFLRRDAMQWFWDQYADDPARRREPTASPLRASLDELAHVPPALVLTAEADVLRDEGEAYAARLREAGAEVTAMRVLGTIHDFVMLDALAGTAAARGALLLTAAWLRHAFGLSNAS